MQFLCHACKSAEFLLRFLSVRIGETPAIRVKKSKNDHKGDLNHFKKIGKQCTRTAAEGAVRGGGAVHLPKKKAARSLAKKAIVMKSFSTPDCMASQT